MHTNSAAYLVGKERRRRSCRTLCSVSYATLHSGATDVCFHESALTLSLGYFSLKVTPSLRPSDLWLQLLDKHLEGHVPLSRDDLMVAHSMEMIFELHTLLRDYANRAEKLLDAIAWILVQKYLWAMAASPRTGLGNRSTDLGTIVPAPEACQQLVDSRLGLLLAAPHVVSRYTSEVRVDTLSIRTLPY